MLSLYRKPFGALSYEELLSEGYAVVGSPGTVAARLTEMHDQLGGYGQLIGLFAIGPATREQTRRSTELFATEVIPALRHLGTGQLGAGS
jgi:alkanesulfonate monooxygenase SsuD/methylene tetrahydromethanopterin reductase-like flavin-dependent oxidoreductase (luciferase family)